MLEEGISYTTFAFPVAHDVQSYTSQVHALVNSGIQVRGGRGGGGGGGGCHPTWAPCIVAERISC